jgi:hypothetical protein
MQTGSSETHWLEIWKNHLGPNGGSVVMDSVVVDTIIIVYKIKSYS